MQCHGFPLESLLIDYVDDESIVEFRVEPQDLSEWLNQRAITFHYSLLKRSMPSPEENGLCKYCPFKYGCQSSNGRELEYAYSNQSESS